MAMLEEFLQIQNTPPTSFGVFSDLKVIKDDELEYEDLKLLLEDHIIFEKAFDSLNSEDFKQIRVIHNSVNNNKYPSFRYSEDDKSTYEELQDFYRHAKSLFPNDFDISHIQASDLSKHILPE